MRQKLSAVGLEQVDEKDEEHIPNSQRNTIDRDEESPNWGMTRAELQPKDGGRSSAMFHKDEIIRPLDAEKRVQGSVQTVDSFMTDPSSGPRTDHSTFQRIKIEKPKESRFTETDTEKHIRLTMDDVPARGHASAQTTIR